MRLNARGPPGDRLVVLVDVVQRRLEDAVGLPVVPDLDQQLEDRLPVIGERAHVEVVHGQATRRDADLGRRLSHLARQGVGREAVRERPRRDRERDIAHLGARFDETRHRAAAAELAVVGVRREHERALGHRRSRGLAAARARARRPRGRAGPRRAGPRKERCRRCSARESRSRLVRTPVGRPRRNPGRACGTRAERRPTSQRRAEAWEAVLRGDGDRRRVRGGGLRFLALQVREIRVGPPKAADTDTEQGMVHREARALRDEL